MKGMQTRRAAPTQIALWAGLMPVSFCARCPDVVQMQGLFPTADQLEIFMLALTPFESPAQQQHAIQQAKARQARRMQALQKLHRLHDEHMSQQRQHKTLDEVGSEAAVTVGALGVAKSSIVPPKAAGRKMRLQQRAQTQQLLSELREDAMESGITVHYDDWMEKLASNSSLAEWLDQSDELQVDDESGHAASQLVAENDLFSIDEISLQSELSSALYDHHADDDSENTETPQTATSDSANDVNITDDFMAEMAQDVSQWSDWNPTFPSSYKEHGGNVDLPAVDANDQKIDNLLTASRSTSHLDLWAVADIESGSSESDDCGSSVLRLGPEPKFSRLLELFLEFAAVDQELYFVSDGTDMVEVAKLIDGVKMPLHSRFIFCMAPVDTDNALCSSALQQYASHFAKWLKWNQKWQGEAHRAARAKKPTVQVSCGCVPVHAPRVLLELRASCHHRRVSQHLSSSRPTAATPKHGLLVRAEMVVVDRPH